MTRGVTGECKHSAKFTNSLTVLWSDCDLLNSLTLINSLIVFVQARRWTGCNAMAAATSGSTCTAWASSRARSGRTTTTCAAPAPPTTSSDLRTRHVLGANLTTNRKVCCGRYCD